MLNFPIDRTQGDLKILAMAVQALIESHPDKKNFHKTFLNILDNFGVNSLYSGDDVQPYTAQLLQDILRTASSRAELPADSSSSDSSS